MLHLPRRAFTLIELLVVVIILTEQGRDSTSAEANQTIDRSRDCGS
jgi:prepilin-type N-terminal cleavage/methylation domain-containing protein